MSTLDISVSQSGHLEELQINMSDRFHDLLLLIKIPDCVINPFLCVSSKDTGEADETLLK